MLIDWFTVAAQIFNFLILVALLKHFLYGRIINAMDRREARITSRLQDAEEKKKLAEEEAAEYNQKIQDFNVQREEMFYHVKEDAEAFRKDLLQKVPPRATIRQLPSSTCRIQGRSGRPRP